MGTDMFLFISALRVEGSSLHMVLKFRQPLSLLSGWSTPLGRVWREGRVDNKAVRGTIYALKYGAVFISFEENDYVH